MNIETLSAFRDELEKLAVPAALVRAGRFLSESPARTALLGAGAGAVGGAASSGEGDRLGGAVRGALGGAALGGAVGGAGRAYRDTHLLSNTPLTAGQAVLGTAKRLGEGVKRFGRRQIHGLTGAYADPAATGIRSSHVAKEQANLLEKRLADRLKDVKDPLHAEKLREGVKKQIEGVHAEGAAGDAALKAGITSLPGVVRGLASKDRRAGTVKALGHAMTGGAGLMSVGGALGVGLPAAVGVHDLSRGDESATGGRTIAQKAMNLGTNVGVGALTGGLPLGAQMLVGSAADAAGQKLVSPKWRRSHHSVVGESLYLTPPGGAQ